jgi:hypothetical protein
MCMCIYLVSCVCLCVYMYSDIDILYIRWMIYTYLYICIQDGVMRLFRDIGVLFKISVKGYMVLWWVGLPLYLFYFVCC